MRIKFLESFIIFVILSWTLNVSFTNSQIVITQDELPSALGTALASSYDTTEHAIVDVGSPGPNQTWTFTQPINGIDITTKVVDLNSTPFAADFPSSNWVIKYSDGLLDLIYSDVFPQIKGDVYLREAVIAGSLQITDSFIEGSLDMLKAFIGRGIDLRGVNVQEFLILKEAKIKGDVALEGAKYKEIIK